MKRNKIYMMCMILAGILFFGSVGAIVRICMSYREGEQVYEELEEYIREPESTKEPEAEKSSEENSAFTFLQVDFESLQSINPEVIAWIQIPALDISYGGMVSIVLSALLFAFLHIMAGGVVLVLGSLIVGVILGVICIRTKSLLPAIAAHIFANLPDFIIPILPELTAILRYGLVIVFASVFVCAIYIFMKKK